MRRNDNLISNKLDYKRLLCRFVKKDIEEEGDKLFFI